MPLPLRENYILSQNYLDIDEYVQAIAISQGSLDVAQLGRGSFRAELVNLSLGPFLINHSKINRSCMVRGKTPAAISFGLPVTMESSGSWMRKPLELSTVQSYAQNNEFEAVTPTGFENVICTVLPNKLDPACHSEEFPDFVHNSKRNLRISCGSKVRGYLNSELLGLLSLIQQNPKLLEQQSWVSDCCEEISALLDQINTSNNDSSRAFRGRMKSAIVARAIDYLESMQGEMVSVQDLRKHCNASRSTLERAFKERYGIMPKAFLTAHCLNGVRKALKIADPETFKISDVAGRFGFWHMSQFAADYRRQFGELPSETLTRTRSAGLFKHNKLTICKS
ncbi:helix-turn-helix domain-containing protein [Gammaproteobacteria bacterium]|nr:helix-turn-helix domain-containing protein [Gammaproteobacteria bacterium]